MKLLITTGPTREYLDSVRFLSNGSSGKMGVAVAQQAMQAGHEVLLLAGPGVEVPSGINTQRFTSVKDLREALSEHFHACDALIMAAAVGDFTLVNPAARKLSRHNGPITITLLPTEDLLAGVSAKRNEGQIICAFAVEDGPLDQVEAKARSEMYKKGANMTVVNMPQAMGADKSQACIISPNDMLVDWQTRTKHQLADEIIKLLENMR